ncbi:branched chain amino acid aminotransferase [Bacillus halotolerans]|uniref:Branched-chain-amino-acid aminotransferase n=1 Tax=Bacillus halotolerans TaxID=260554 RepID=A0A9Q6F2J2_9BACI|nr:MULTISPECIES: branched-chain amino acid aminotransferase [Bacillus]MBV7320034.1 branched-chain amino acid aminotransferase [Halalkalibacterium halodurans]AZV49123.1 branched-chain amino acid aminotransferase [Bacillus halotolerans]MBU5247394.1 branched-chain amino acid aminotransferase [Bacillus halotolerans]MCP9300599.1 branched-chain amino acid aminotransferase [Bacillus halotolerans]MEC1602337.1 branched-chain amino acid aminotransferase [Bacillus halotolerans]
MNKLIEREKITSKKEKPDPSSLGFGKYFTDYMFVMDYEEEKGWHRPRLTPYAPIMLDPSSSVFHYGQAVFEGLKAYRTEDGRVLLFRPEQNIKRLNRSCQRMSMPPVDEELVLEALTQLVELEKEWVPREKGTSLYIRPFVIATEPSLGVKASKNYTFMIVLSPVGSYYGDQLQPINIYVEDEFVRAVNGGVGNAKTSGNYAASLQAQQKANELGYDQVLWLDAIEKKYAEEVGSMNIFFVINGEVVTPALSGSILSGITRASAIELIRSWGIPVREEKISIDDIYAASARGELTEVFGTGTAAVVTPVGELNIHGRTVIVNDRQIGEISKKLYQTITDIQLGKVKDPFHWTVEV